MKIRILTTFLALAAMTFGISAQTIQSPVVNPDHTVTFNYVNPTASEVLVDVQFAGRNAMTKGADGVWTVTLGPAAPDIYPYCFVVDGNSVMDPCNPDFFPNETFKNSLLDLSMGSDGMIYQQRDVPHGSVDYITYKSGTFGLYGNAIVYTPASYRTSPDKAYPVMYLISGTTDTEEVYYKVGKVNLILDNLIAEGAAEEMIVVLPYGNPSKYFPAGVNTWTMGDIFSKDFVNDLMPYIEANYRTINDRDHRAVGGFSRGGNQGLALGLTNLDKFSWLCSYSSFTSMTLPGIYDDAARLNRDIHLFWLGVGTDDFLYGNAKEYMDFLDSKGITNRKIFTTNKFGHTWMNARYFLDQSLRLLFKEDPYSLSEDTVLPPKPAPKKTSSKKQAKQDEQRLTPEVMARLFPAGVVSPEYQSGKVTFRFRDANARTVELESQICGGKVAMTRDMQGVWSITVNAKPDIYPYCFIVDGTHIADPNNMFIFPSEGFKYSVADLRADTPAVQDLQDVPHGNVAYRLFGDAPACIYTPAGYDSLDKLPVLVLLHGEGETHESWIKAGRANNILDNLAAKGLGKKMIAVMPYSAKDIDAVIAAVRKEYKVSGDQKEWTIAGWGVKGLGRYGTIRPFKTEDNGALSWLEARKELELLIEGISEEQGLSASTNINAGGYPKILKDNSVIFKFRGTADARPQIDLCGKKYDMTYTPDGFWTCRTDPQVPGFHYYFLVVNGVSSADPASESFYGCGKMSSAIEIPEKGCELFEIQDVPHGQVRELNYFSQLTGSWRPVLVYTPASYEKGKKKYPVVYIHHGGGEDHRGWVEQGRMGTIMDNLIAAGQAEEMIVVSVNSNVPAGPGMRGGYNWEGMKPYRDELIDNIIPFIEGKFRIKADKSHRAMCGLSMGGGQSFYIGLRSPETFANVGMFSTGIFGGIAGSADLDFEAQVPGMISETSRFNDGLDVFFISCGEQDPRITYTRQAVQKMKEAGVEVNFASYPGDHEWQVWRKSFAEFARMLFR